MSEYNLYFITCDVDIGEPLDDTCTVVITQVVAPDKNTALKLVGTNPQIRNLLAKGIPLKCVNIGATVELIGFKLDIVRDNTPKVCN